MMTFIEAAITVLAKANEPLSIAEITRLALEEGLIESIGNAPRQTMANIIAASIRREQEGGELSPFFRVGRGLYRLRQQDDPLPEHYLDNAVFWHYSDFLSYKEAAYEILQFEGRPMHVSEITTLAIEWELINPQGMNPEASLSAQLYRDIQQKGAASIFRREGAGIFGLAEWERDVDSISKMAGQQRHAVKQQLLNVIRHIDPYAFEQLVARLLSKMGYNNIIVTRRSADEGVDVVADISVGVMMLKTAIQVKRLRSNVGRPLVSQFRGDMLAMKNIDQGLIITTSGFTKGALEVARLPNTIPIILIDGDQLTDLLIVHRIGVKVQHIEVVSFESDNLIIDEFSSLN